MIFPLFLIPVAVGLVAQGLKPILNKTWYSELTKEGRKLPRYGGMPSAHTAFATSLVTVVGLVDGFNSASFAIAFTVMIFILDDALRMRIFLGRHGRALHLLVSKLPNEEKARYPRLETHLGHKPMEVLAGAGLGIILSWIIILVIGL